DLRVETQPVQQGLHGLPAPHQWRADDGLHREAVEAGAEGIGLGAADVVQTDARGSAGQGPRRVGGRSSVPEKDDGHVRRLPTPDRGGGPGQVAGMVPVASRPMTSRPSRIRYPANQVSEWFSTKRRNHAMAA